MARAVSSGGNTGRPPVGGGGAMAPRMQTQMINRGNYGRDGRMANCEWSACVKGPMPPPPPPPPPPTVDSLAARKVE